jgi:hypothetical protein
VGVLHEIRTWESLSKQIKQTTNTMSEDTKEPPRSVEQN